LAAVLGGWVATAVRRPEQMRWAGTAQVGSQPLRLAPLCYDEPYPMLRRQRVRGGCWSIVDLKGPCLIDLGKRAIDGAQRALWI
jgi:hypothetical protein